jgi:DNA-binding NarL/FixJ family response regulator
VGRNAELGAAATFLAAVADGPAGLLVEGEAGIGKTTVWRAVARAATSAGYLVLSATAVDDEADLPFVALRDLLEVVASEVTAALPAVQRTALDAALLRSAQPPAAAEQHAVSAAVLGLVRALAADRPLVVAVDDVPWLDRPSERVLRYVVRRLGGVPVGVLAARRPSAEDDLPLGLDALSAQQLVLGPLEPDALHTVLAAQPGPPLPMRVIRRIHRLCEGNPFHATEIARVVRTQGQSALHGGELPLPSRIVATTAQRLARLQPAAREVLAVVAEAVPATVDQVIAVLGDTSAAGLAEAVADGLLAIDGPKVRFVHPLLRAAVAAGLSEPERRAVHRGLADTAADLDQRAVHLAVAVSEPDEAVALGLEQAASRICLRGAPETAAALARRSVALTPPGAELDVARRELAVAEYLYRCHDLAGTEALLARLVEDLPRGPLRAEGLLWHSTVLYDLGPLDEAATAARQAIDEAGDGVVRASAQRHLAQLLLRGGDAEGAFRSAEAGMRTAEVVADPAVLAEARGALAWMRFWNGGGADADLVAGGDAHRWTRFAPHETRPAVLAARMLTWCDQLDAARRVLTADLQRARDEGLDRAAALLLANLAEIACYESRYEEAGAHVAEGEAAAELVGGGFVRSWLLYARGLAAAHQGRIDEARTCAEDGTLIVVQAGLTVLERFHRGLSCLVELSAGDAAAAVRHVEPLLGIPAGNFEPGVHRFVPDAVEALAALGDIDRADTLLLSFEAQATRLDRAWGLVAAARARAVVESARDDLAAAARAADIAADACIRLPLPFERARTLLVLGTVQRRTRRRRDARATLGVAIEEFDRLGSPLWAGRARDEQARIGGRAPSPDALTEAERRIVELVVAGRSNKEVAATLYLALSTVEAALWRVYRKVGVRSRTELAAYIRSAGS